MKKILTFVVALTATLATAPIFADTLELVDGRLLEGNFIGSSNGVYMFDTGSGIEAFPEYKVIALYVSAGVEAAMAMVEEPRGQVVVPAGTRLVIRMSDTVDSNTHGAGHRFRAQLEGALVVDGVTAVPRGTVVQGRITQAQQSRRATGSSELAIEFTDFKIDDVFVPIATEGLQAQTQNEAGRTAGRTARAAVVGGLVGGSRGARYGAIAGATASVLTGGASINIPRGTIVETSLRTPVTVQL